MKRIVLSLMVLAATPNLCAQGSRQTARQALLEMFFSKTPGTFVQHLPAVTRTALEKSGAMAGLQSYSVLLSQAQSQGQNYQTYETGPVLFSGTDPKTGQKADITILSDAGRGDQEEIAVSFQIYKNGQAERTPYMPQLTFSMKQESQIWKLNEISITIHVPLADPDLLKALTEKMKPPVAVATNSEGGPSLTRSSMTMQSNTSDVQVIEAMRTILAAETTYTHTYANVGYTCTLSNLDGFGGGEPNEHQAMLINSGLASGKKFGYVFTLTGCNAAPAASFRLNAVPAGEAYGRKAYCADPSGVVRSSDDGNAANCQAHGMPIP